VAIALALAACGKKAPREAPAPETEPAAPAAPGEPGKPGKPGPPGDGSGAQAAAGAAGEPWPELEGLPRTGPVRVVPLPTKLDVPRFSVGGPVIAGDVAVVASSQFGFVAVDWRRGAIAWSKPAGLHVAPPVVMRRGDDDAVVLVGECFNPPAVPAGEHLLGCLRVVTPTGADQAYMAIHGKPDADEPFAAEPGAQALWPAPPRAVRWRRGDRAVTVDLMTGAATPAASIEPPPLVIEHGARRWEIEQDDGQIVARTRRGGPVAWRTENPYTAVLGAVWQEDASPMIRIATLAAGGAPRVRVIDMDATGSLRSASARSMPGIALLGWGTSPVGEAALASRRDRSRRRVLLAGFAGSARVQGGYPLPEQPRPDPVGVAVAPDAVVVFHDGDTLTILPELSALPTAPGAASAASRNPTP
jgi:hypothetical protein